jgi:hypothetical protein
LVKAFNRPVTPPLATSHARLYLGAELLQSLVLHPRRRLIARIGRPVRNQAEDGAQVFGPRITGAPPEEFRRRLNRAAFCATADAIH